MPCSLSWLPSATRSWLRRSAIEKQSAHYAEKTAKPLDMPCLAGRSLTQYSVSCPAEDLLHIGGGCLRPSPLCRRHLSCRHLPVLPAGLHPLTTSGLWPC